MKRMFTVFLCVILGTFMCGCGAEGGESSTATSGVAYISNPWETCTNDEINASFGMSFAIPEGATDVVFRIAKSIEMGEARFTLDGVKWNARVSKASEYGDNTGMYYEWTEVKESKLTILPEIIISGEEKYYESDSEKVYAGMWFFEDETRKLMYSVSTSGFETIPDVEKVKKVFQK